MTRLKAVLSGLGWLSGFVQVVLLVMAVAWIPQVHAAEAEKSDNGISVLEAFDKQQQQRVQQESALTDHEKHLIMFSLAIPLLILLLITAGLGIATGVFGKKLFIPHMITAGLTITLAVAHVVAGLVWFYPF